MACAEGKEVIELISELQLHRRLAMPSRCFIVDDADAELNVLLVLFVINNEIDIDNLDNDIDVEIDHLDDHLDDHHNFVC